MMNWIKIIFSSIKMLYKSQVDCDCNKIIRMSNYNDNNNNKSNNNNIF